MKIKNKILLLAFLSLVVISPLSATEIEEETSEQRVRSRYNKLLASHDTCIWDSEHQKMEITDLKDELQHCQKHKEELFLKLSKGFSFAYDCAYDLNKARELLEKAAERIKFLEAKFQQTTVESFLLLEKIEKSLLKEQATSHEDL